MVIRHDANRSLILQRQRTTNVFTDEIGIARIFRIHGHGGITRDRLRTRRRNGQPSAWSFDNFHFKMIHEAFLLLHDDFLITQCSQGGGAPVHHAFATVNETFFVEVHKHAHDAAIVVFIKSKALAAPVTGGAKLLELIDDDVALFVFPFPDFFDQLFTSQIIAVFDDALFFERLFHHVLRGQTCVVSAWQPEHFLPCHACTAAQDVLNGIIQDMAHVQNTCDVRRRDDDGVSWARLADTSGIGFKAFVIQPALIPA